MVTTKRTAALTQSVISLLSHFHTSLSTLVFTKVHKYYAIAQHTPQKTALEQKKKKSIRTSTRDSLWQLYLCTASKQMSHKHKISNPSMVC